MTYHFGTRHDVTDLSKVVSMQQRHTGNVRYVTESDIGTEIPECDGIVTDRRNVTLSVKTADCVPLLMWTDNVIAAVHAGWRGTIQSIAVNAVDIMRDHGAKREDIRAAIGPSIRFECYEVKRDFYDAVESALGTEYADMFIRDGHADVAGMNVKLLTDCGINPEHITIHPDCTYCNTDKYNSYRGSGGSKDVQRSVIVM